MWAQSWENIIDLILPYPNSQKLDITAILKRKKFTTEKIVQVGISNVLLLSSLKMRILNLILLYFLLFLCTDGRGVFYIYRNVQNDTKFLENVNARKTNKSISPVPSNSLRFLKRIRLQVK